jgi:hypothetical protein
MPHLDNLAMEAIVARSSLIAEMQLRPACRQFLNQFAYLVGPVRHRSLVTDFTAPFALRYRHRDRRLVDIQPDKRDILHVVSPPFFKARRPPAGRNPRTEIAAGEANNPVSSHRDHGV